MFRIETRNAADDEDYVSCIVCVTEEEANELLSQYNKSRQGVHTLIDTDAPEPEAPADETPDEVPDEVPAESEDFDPAFSPANEKVN